MRFPLAVAPFLVLFFAISVHSYDQQLLMQNQEAAGNLVFPPVTAAQTLAPAEGQGGNRNDALLEGGGPQALEALLEEGQQRATLPKVRGRRGLALGLILVLAFLLYGAIASANNSNVHNSLLSTLKNPQESLATKARAIGLHVMDPGALTPLSGVLLIAYAAAWALSVSGLVEVIKSKKLIKKFKEVQGETPTLPPDLRARNLGAIGAVLAVVASLGLLLNIHTLFYYYVNVGVGILGAGVVMAIAKMLAGNASIDEVLFPERVKAKEQNTQR